MPSALRQWIDKNFDLADQKQLAPWLRWASPRQVEQETNHWAPLPPLRPNQLNGPIGVGIEPTGVVN